MKINPGETPLDPIYIPRWTANGRQPHWSTRPKPTAHDYARSSKASCGLQSGNPGQHVKQVTQVDLAELLHVEGNLIEAELKPHENNFQEARRKWRELNDRILNALNGGTRLEPGPLRIWVKGKKVIVQGIPAFGPAWMIQESAKWRVRMSETEARRERGTGSIFKPKYKVKATGEVKESRHFWIQFYRDGTRFMQNTHSNKITIARRLLTKKLGTEHFIRPQAEKVRSVKNFRREPLSRL